MGKKGYLEIKRGRHGLLWWCLIGWWERPLATGMWLLLAEIWGYKGVRYNYYK